MTLSEEALKEVTAYIYSKFDFLPGTNQKIRNHKPTCTVTGLIINFICHCDSISSSDGASEPCSHSIKKAEIPNFEVLVGRDFL